MADEIEEMRALAERFRRLATAVEDERNRTQLLEMAADLDKRADAFERAAREGGEFR